MTYSFGMHSLVLQDLKKNDINIIDASPVMVKLLSSNAKLFTYKLHGQTFSTLYYLGDGIYPE
jgi:hypothetical protein